MIAKWCELTWDANRVQACSSEVIWEGGKGTPSHTRAHSGTVLVAASCPSERKKGPRVDLTYVDQWLRSRPSESPTHKPQIANARRGESALIEPVFVSSPKRVGSERWKWRRCEMEKGKPSHKRLAKQGVSFSDE